MDSHVQSGDNYPSDWGICIQGLPLNPANETTAEQRAGDKWLAQSFRNPSDGMHKCIVAGGVNDHISVFNELRDLRDPYGLAGGAMDSTLVQGA